MHDWDIVLGHRPAETRDVVRDRFIDNGMSAESVSAALDDGGDALFAAAAGGKEGWADPFGGALAAALLAAEVGALTAHLTSRASSVRALAVSELLDDFSAITVATRLGVSRQKVYGIGRPPTTWPFIDNSPWSTP